MEERTAYGTRGHERDLRRCLRPDRLFRDDDDDEDESGPNNMWANPDHGGVHTLFTATATRETAADNEDTAAITAAF
jgi:hypothetical protein